MRYVLLALVLLATPVAAQDEKKFRDEPDARAVHDRMLGALREAETLSFEGEYWWGREGRENSRARYRVWLKKPNHFRIEAIGESGNGGTCVGDGRYMWTFWRDKRPRWNDEHYGTWEQTSENVYMRAPTPPAAHSIAHQTSWLGAGMSMTVLELSRFHGAGSSMAPYLDGVRSLGVAEVDNETCDVIEASYMSHQRSKICWVARSDSLPRRLKQIVRVRSGDIVTNELWTAIRVNDELKRELFVWTPPEGWREWRRPSSRQRALTVGAQAPALSGTLLGGGRASLADYRGKIVWLCFWRVG